MSTFSSVLWLTVGLFCGLQREFAPGPSALPQGCRDSPECLIRILNHELGSHARIDNGIDQDDAAASLQLIGMGRPAVPAIESALDSLETEGKRARVATAADWLLFTYARIEGGAAVPRLTRMLGNPDMWVFSSGLERALAISLAVTSFRTTLSGPRVESPTPGWRYPQDGLDQFLLSWAIGDRCALEASLSDESRARLDELIRLRTWEWLRARYGAPPPGAVTDFAYRLSLPSAPVRDPRKLAVGGPRMHPGNPESTAVADVVLFKRQSACGVMRVRFRAIKYEQIGAGLWKWRYVIDNNDLDRLFEALTPCLSSAVARPAR